MLAPRHLPMSLDEYLAFEDRNPIRHEYIDGVVHAMSGATRRHNQICGNIYVRLRDATRVTGCRTFIEGVKLVARRVVYYPDIMVACGPAPADERIETSPTLVVEVLSPSTERTDRREKLLTYKEIDSVQTYLIVHHDQRMVERHWRDPDAGWLRDVISERGAVPLLLVADTLSLDDIYEGIALPSPEQRLRLRELAEAYG